MMRLATLGIGLIALAGLPGHSQASVYNAVADFAALPGLSGAFTDGYRIGSTGFIAYDASTGTCAGIADLTCNYSSLYTISNLPAVGKNTRSNGSDIVSGTVVIPDDVLFMHPVGDNSGLAPGDTIVRFTAPTSDSYTVSGSFQLLDVRPSGVVVSVEGIGSNFANVSLTGSLNTTVAFSFTSALSAGETLDFVVNSAGSYYNDSTGLKATIATVPEPASLALMGMGLLGLGWIRRRKA